LSTAIARHFAGHRIQWSRAILAAALAYVLFGEPPEVLDGWPGEVLRLCGYVLMVAGSLWRVWCLMFIGGTKDGVLTTTGPYSVVRNPLYVGSFLGVVGFGLAARLPLLPVALLVLFAVLYPAVVASEEKRLEELFGDDFRRYRDATPRWVPRWSLYAEPESISVSPKKVRQGISDAMWYLWAYAFVQTLDLFHRAGILPVLF
jgi:protein-S-isoprenylcysteine O-methyltransferase Ste14